jgi:transketolase C-terminal domain/subunit
VHNLYTDTIIAVGMLVQATLEAADTLHAEGISVSVLNMQTIKPLGMDSVVAPSRETGVIVGASTDPVRVYRAGNQDTFGHSGDAEDLMDLYDLLGKKSRKNVFGDFKCSFLLFYKKYFYPTKYLLLVVDLLSSLTLARNWAKSVSQ